MAIYAVIENGIVATTVVWDGETEVGTLAGKDLVFLHAKDESPVGMPGPGWAYVGGEFHDVRQPEPEPDEEDEDDEPEAWAPPGT